MSKKKIARVQNIPAPRKLWLAGLGVAAVAQKQGEQAVEQLNVRVADTKKQLASATKQAKRTVDAYVKPIRARAVRAAKHVEITVADQVGAAIGKLGIPSKNEVAALLSRVEQLKKQVQAKARARAR